MVTNQPVEDRSNTCCCSDAGQATVVDGASSTRIVVDGPATIEITPASGSSCCSTNTTAPVAQACC